MATWLVWTLAIVGPIVVGIIFFLIWKAIDRKMDKVQRGWMEWGTLFAKYNCPLLAQIFNSLAIDDYETALNEIKRILGAPDTIKTFIDEVVIPIHDAYEQDPELVKKYDS